MLYGCPHPIIRNPGDKQVNDAFGEFHTVIIDNYSGINDIKVYFFLPLLILVGAPIVVVAVVVNYSHIEHSHSDNCVHVQEYKSRYVLDSNEESKQGASGVVVFGTNKISRYVRINAIS